MLASLRAQQQILDSNANVVDNDPALPEHPYDPGFTQVASTTKSINDCIAAIMNTLGGRKIVGLDCEWKVLFHRRGIGGQGKVALMQIAYIDDNGQM